MEGNMKKVICFIVAAVVLTPLLSGCATYVRPGPVIVAGPPPYAGAVWIPGHYGPYGGWHPGHWRSAY
jgi:hypothetical protein